MIQVKIFNHDNNLEKLETKINNFFKKNEIKKIEGFSGVCSGGYIYIIIMYNER